MNSTTRHSAPQASVSPPLALSNIGGDFDFFGKTQKVADVMEEEQMTYARSHTTQKPPPTQAARHAEFQQYQQQQQFSAQRQQPARTVCAEIDD
jgi:hypothetical protein